MKDAIVFLNAVRKHLTLLITGGAIIALLGIIEHKYGTTLSWSKYASLLFMLFAVSCFMVWREEYNKYIELNERVRPKLKLKYSEEKKRPWQQTLENYNYGNTSVMEQTLYRFGIFNESQMEIKDIKVVLDKVELGDPNCFFPGHCLRVMGSQTKSPLFNLGPQATQYIDIVGYALLSSGEQSEYYYIPYAELGEIGLPPGNYQLLFRVDGGGMPCFIKASIKHTDDKFDFMIKSAIDTGTLTTG